MKPYSVAAARKQLASVLDQAEAGDEVLIERRGVTFRLGLVKARPKKRKGARLEIVDPAVEQGNWTWSWTPRRGARFARDRGA